MFIKQCYFKKNIGQGIFLFKCRIQFIRLPLPHIYVRVEVLHEKIPH